jgi:SAM-dependent methyltransferase
MLKKQQRLLSQMVEIRHPMINSVEESGAAYDDLHSKGYLRQQDSFYKWLVSLLHPEPGQRLLDISCGQGPLLKFAMDAGLRSVGVDISSIAIRQARTLLAPAIVNVGDAEYLPYVDYSFDYVTNIGSVEHYLHPYLAVQEMHRVLKPTGIACILLPNTFGLLGNILYVWRNGDVFDDGQPLQRYGTCRQWQTLLENNGLQVFHIHKYERVWPRTWQDLIWHMMRPHKLLRAFLTPLIPVNLSSFFVFLCHRSV